MVRHCNRLPGGGGCLVLREVQHQARPGAMQPDLTVGVSVHYRGVGLDDL